MVHDHIVFYLNIFGLMGKYFLQKRRGNREKS